MRPKLSLVNAAKRGLCFLHDKKHVKFAALKVEGKRRRILLNRPDYKFSYEGSK
jgi:hypothetical protein